MHSCSRKCIDWAEGRTSLNSLPSLGTYKQAFLLVDRFDRFTSLNDTSSVLHSLQRVIFAEVAQDSFFKDTSPFTRLYYIVVAGSAIFRTMCWALCTLGCRADWDEVHCFLMQASVATIVIDVSVVVYHFDTDGLLYLHNCLSRCNHLDTVRQPTQPVL